MKKVKPLARHVFELPHLEPGHLVNVHGDVGGHFVQAIRYHHW